MIIIYDINYDFNYIINSILRDSRFNKSYYIKNFTIVFKNPYYIFKKYNYFCEFNFNSWKLSSFLNNHLNQQYFYLDFILSYPYVNDYRFFKNINYFFYNFDFIDYDFLYEWNQCYYDLINNSYNFSVITFDKFYYIIGKNFFNYYFYTSYRNILKSRFFSHFYIHNGELCVFTRSISIDDSPYCDIVNCFPFVFSLINFLQFRLLNLLNTHHNFNLNMGVSTFDSSFYIRLADIFLANKLCESKEYNYFNLF